MHAFIEFHWHELVTINFIEGKLTELNTNVIEFHKSSVKCVLLWQGAECRQS